MKGQIQKIISCSLKRVFVILMLFSCERSVNPKDTPECIRKMIDEIRRDPVRSPPAEIWQYNYNNMTIYFTPQYCCDIPSMLVDENCNFICSPDGGFSGVGDGKCTDFFKNRTNGKLIWKDERAN